MAATVTLRLNGAPQSVTFGERTTDALRWSQSAGTSAAAAAASAATADASAAIASSAAGSAASAVDNYALDLAVRGGTLKLFDQAGETQVPLIGGMGRAYAYLDTTTGRVGVALDLDNEMSRIPFARLLASFKSYTGTEQIIPILGSMGKTFLGVDRTTGNIYAQGLSTSTPVTATPLPSADQVTLLTGGGWNAMIAYGQSLAEGYKATPVLSTSQPYSNLTFGAGPRSAKNGNAAGATYTAPGTSTVKALVEDSASPSPAGFTLCGETICAGATAELNTRAAIYGDRDPSSIKQFASCAAHGGSVIANLAVGSTWGNHLKDHISEGIARAQDAGVDYQLTDVCWIQGESDADAATDRATYGAALPAIRSDIETYYHTATASAGGSVTPKTNPVHMFVLQTSTLAANAGPLSALEAIALAQTDAAAADPRIHIVGPGYPFPRQPSDSVHLLNTSEEWVARYFGRVRYQALVQGNQPDRFQFLSAVAVGTAVTINCATPSGQVVLDTAAIPMTTDFGIKIVDDTGTLTLSDFQVIGDKIVLTVDRALGTNPVFRYGLDYVPDGLLLNGFGGNVNDGTTDSFAFGGVTYPRPHWAPHASLPILVLENN